MELRLFGGWDIRIPNYSIKDHLLYGVLSGTAPSELNPREKLYVAHAHGFSRCHSSYLAQIFLECGCFDEARAHYLDPEHPRKLGDICWCQGLLDQAEAYYSQKTSQAQPYRHGADYDRLIKLAFVREDWGQVIDRFAGAGFTRGINGGRVCIGSGEATAQPFLDMLAVALNKIKAATPPQVAAVLKEPFDLNERAWGKVLADSRHLDPRNIAKLTKRARPRVGASRDSTLAESLLEGQTHRAMHVSRYISQADENLAAAQIDLVRFGESGDEIALESFLAYVTGSGIRALSHSFLFAAFGHDSFPTSFDLPATRLIRLLSSHRVMSKRHFGHLLKVRFESDVPLTAEDVLTGIFQWHAFPSESARFDLATLASCREWALIRLEDWLEGKLGAGGARQMAQAWRTGAVRPSASPFFPAPATPASPRNTVEWEDLILGALSWLKQRWSREIGTSRWLSENQLFQILKRKLRPLEVQQHARPTWLDPQHLDVYVPKAGIAVEYMGQQHFEPLAYFGGQKAHELLVIRDRKKAALCARNGVELVRVRFDDDLGARATQIAEQIRTSARSPVRETQRPTGAGQNSPTEFASIVFAAYVYR